MSCAVGILFFAFLPFFDDFFGSGDIDLDLDLDLSLLSDGDLGAVADSFSSDDTDASLLLRREK